MRASVVLALFTLTGTGCSTHAWNGEVPQSPLLGIENGIWRFPTPQPPPSAVPAPSASPAGEEPELGEPKRRGRMPKPYALKPERSGEALTRR